MSCGINDPWAGPVRFLARALIRPSHMAISVARPGAPRPSITNSPEVVHHLSLASQAALRWRRGGALRRAGVPYATATAIWWVQEGDATPTARQGGSGSEGCCQVDHHTNM